MSERINCAKDTKRSSERQSCDDTFCSASISVASSITISLSHIFWELSFYFR